MLIEKNVSLQSDNTFGIAAHARALMRVHHQKELIDLAEQLKAERNQFFTPRQRLAPKEGFFVLGGGSNIVLTADVQQLVLKMEIRGLRLVQETEDAWVIEAGAGERWHDLVRWSLEQGYWGLENMALIPGTVGAAPVQNIGAYGVELQDRFYELEAVDLWTGKVLTLNAAQCAFAYRDSIFKHAPISASDDGKQPWKPDLPISKGLAGRAVVAHVRLLLPKKWQPMLEYADLQRRIQETGINQPTAEQIFDWVVQIRRQKLPDPAEIGNAGSFFKNPIVTPAQCMDIISREPRIVHYAMPDGSFKLAAASMIDVCGWRGKSVGQAAVYEKQALVLINRGKGQHGATGEDVMTLAKEIQASIKKRFGITLEIEPVVV